VRWKTPKITERSKQLFLPIMMFSRQSSANWCSSLLSRRATNRLSRYEATLWRQAGRILYALADVVASEHLAVAVNGTLFSSKSSWWRHMPGDPTNAVNPVLADHVISHEWFDTYLLWFCSKYSSSLLRSSARHCPIILNFSSRMACRIRLFSAIIRA
jgi:hypothetical protein